MLLISESFAIFLFTFISSFLALPTLGYRVYKGSDLAKPGTWVLLLNSVMCITASCFQEAMVRRIKKRYGYISLVLFICAIPITFYSLMFYDSAPYFTLCIFGCFSVENCTTNDKNWGKYTSLSYVFSLAFLLSAQALSIRFNLIFIKFTSFDVKKMVNEVNEKYSKDKKKKNDGKEEDDDDDDDSEFDGKPNTTRMNAISTKIDNKDDQIDMHSDKGANSANYMSGQMEFSGFHRERFQNEFTKVAATFKPIKYKN